MSIFSVDTIVVELLGYPMSYLELFGTVLYLWSVWLITRRRVLTWPVGIVSVSLYMALFYQIRLYSDALEQVYYLIICTYGWWRWADSAKGNDEVENVAFGARESLFFALVVTSILSLSGGYFMNRADILFPYLFPEPASFPYLDALTTFMSFTAMWLLARKRIEGWIYWIIVDVIGIGLYYAKDIKFVALLYVVLLVLATRGFVLWLNASSGSVDARARRRRT